MKINMIMIKKINVLANLQCPKTSFDNTQDEFRPPSAILTKIEPHNYLKYEPIYAISIKLIADINYSIRLDVVNLAVLKA